jgi:hypothetical protein
LKKRRVERAIKPVPSEMKEEGDFEGKAAKALVRQLIRPQSRGPRACSDVSQVAVHPHFHCAKIE